MQRKYRKIMVPMKREQGGYSLWKQAAAPPVCYVESYKEKRAVFFQGSNLMPGVDYYVILMGTSDGELKHEDFGPFHTGSNGEVQCYKVFTGAPIDVYEVCLFCAKSTDGQMEILYRGTLHNEEGLQWAALRDQKKPVLTFSPAYDETGAVWYRIDDLENLPGDMADCLPWMEKYGHYIIGRKETHFYLGVPGRFLQKEQPLREKGLFLLWQPIRGGENYFRRPDEMTTGQQERIYGYWIVEVDLETGILQPF